MTSLALNAAKRGDRAEALRWHRQAYESSVGPATRLQWGARYVSALIELEPNDGARVETAINQVLADAEAQPDVFYERSASSLRKLSTKLHAWGQRPAGAGVVRRFDARLGALCGRIDGADSQRATCEALLKPAPKRDA